MTTEPQGTAEARTRLGAAPLPARSQEQSPRQSTERSEPGADGSRAGAGGDPAHRHGDKREGGSPWASAPRTFQGTAPCLGQGPKPSSQGSRLLQAEERQVSKKAPKNAVSFLAFFINNSRKGSAGAVTGRSAGLLPEPAKRHASRLSPAVGPAAASSLRCLWAPGLQPSTLGAAQPAPTARGVLGRVLGRVLGLPNRGNTREQAAEATAASRQRRGGRRKRDLAAAQAGRGRKSPCHISSQDRVRVCLAHRGAVSPYANPGLSRARGQPPQRQPLPQSLQHEEDPVPNPRGRGRPRSASVTARRCHQPYPCHRTPARGPSPAPRTATNGVQGEKGPPPPHIPAG